MLSDGASAANVSAPEKLEQNGTAEDLTSGSASDAVLNSGSSDEIFVSDEDVEVILRIWKRMSRLQCPKKIGKQAMLR